MRAVTMLVGAALLVAACGGEKKAPASEPAAPAAAAPAPAATAPAAPATTGATVNVDMVLEGTAYKYVPAELTVKAGDVIAFKNVSGGPHNVAFDAKGIPAGSEAAIDAALGSAKMGPLTGSLVVEANGVYTLNTAGFPAGKYSFFCTPHQALGMKGVLTVQ
ncbi:MAG: plastocyanin/azurin family copper-binding protein [Gemmatimonadales bacterium]|jgi:plastocyanin|nr:plastocyanin/azurin family copper-binding protein [Gemmatimonadales bacterium]